MQSPLVSIIIPTYNRAHLIEETLASINNQNYQNWQCIIVDDGSTDNTVEVVSKFICENQRFELHIRPTELIKGANSCRNFGFSLAKGEFIQWFDSDDIMLPDFLKKKVVAFSGKLDMVFCSGYITDQNLQTRKKITLLKTVNLYRDYALWKVHIYTPSALIRRRALNEGALFDTSIKRGQETEFFLRLFFNKKSNVYKIMDEHLFLYRMHSENKTTYNEKYNKAYKESQTFICTSNFQRAIQIDDFILVNYYYLALIDLFFLGIQNEHLVNSKHILDFLKPQIKLYTNGKYWVFIFLTKVSIHLRKKSYKIEKKLKRITLGKT